jgi:ABC-type lipoprotein release transport system permease subunit
MDDEKERLLSVIREIYGRVVWTHKVHEKEKELSIRRTKRDKWINVILMALTTTGVLASIPLGTVWTTVVAALLAFISTGFAIYQISFSPEIEILQQRQTAKDLLLERDNLLLLIERFMASDTDIKETRKEIQRTVDRIGQIYAAAPDTSSQAYTLASSGLKMNEELTFSTKEIDLLLPEKLRLVQNDKDEKLESSG